MNPAEKYQLIRRGHPMPLGATLLQEGINFALFSRNAQIVTLIIEFIAGQTGKKVRHEFTLDPEENRTGDIWHILIASHQTNFTYGFQVDTAQQNISGRGTSSHALLIDPYCNLLTPRSWGGPAHYGTEPCSLIAKDDFDWQNDRPLKTPLSEIIIYELHVRGFTQDPSSQVKAPGTFRGIIEKIPYLKELGITAVELMPITEFDENDTVFHDPQTGEKHKNFWGYNPVSFFAVKSAYGSNPEKAMPEFKEMIRELHRAGIEVYLDMVYNHTGEGGYQGTTSSFRGLDNTIYYLLDEHGEYLNFSGCGNTTNCNHPVVRDLIRESLRYWVTEMHVDGFRFDLASILGRDQQGNVLANPPMIEIIGQDPVLRDTKLIAEAWDAAGLYQVGSFSRDDRWAEWNGKFRDDVRAFMLSHNDTVTKLATRIAGSSDLYNHSDRSPLCSINFITSHDGFTLYDLVSYDHKHNMSNGENNEDGENYNLSWNSGFEGARAPHNVEQLRLRRLKTFATLLFLSQGVPMFPAGDEFGRTQNGNNNAWCQDNQTSWLNWKLLEQHSELFNFFKQIIQLRKKHKLFRREDFFTDHSGAVPEIVWQYLEPGLQNWNADCHGLGFHLRELESSIGTSEFFIMINGQRDGSLEILPPPPSLEKSKWRRIVDTSRKPPEDILLFEKAAILQSGRISLPPFTCIVLQAESSKADK